MSRRSKLTRFEREKRQGKRERRAHIPRVRRRHELLDQLQSARATYDAACAEPPGGDRCVCEHCRLEQDAGQGLVLSTGEVTIAPCDFCGHLYAETVESYV